MGRTLYAYTPTQKVIALDAATGKLKWKFDSGIRGTQPARGVAYWTDGKQGRIFAGVMNFLYCLDAETGQADRHRLAKTAASICARTCADDYRDSSPSR